MLEQTINKNKNDIKGSQHDVKKKNEKEKKEKCQYQWTFKINGYI